MSPATHYIPAFTRSVTTAGYTALEQAACGAYVAWEDIAPAETEPTCVRCREYCVSPPRKEGVHAADH